MVGNLFKYTCQFAQEGVFLCYSGPTSHDVLLSTGSSLKQFLDENNIEKKRYYCIFSIYVELFENIMRYGVDCFCADIRMERCRYPYGIITVGVNNDQFTIQSGNIIAVEQSSKLKKKLDLLKTMDPQVIRDYYREKRKQKCCESIKGAGLGLIEIFRKSSQPITYSFDYIDDFFMFYTLKAVI